MKSLGETYDRASESKAAVGSKSDEQSSKQTRGTICFGDVIAMFFGGVVFCLGITLWVSPMIGLFGEGVTGIEKLAELITSLGINTIVVWGLSLYSLDQGTRSQGKRPQPRHSSGPVRLSRQSQDFDTLLRLTLHLLSDNESDGL
jgi:hypothetical protein